MIWPPEHIELLRELYTQGPRSWVARELTARTGVAYGRNAIVGKLHRLGLCEPKQTKDKRKVIKQPHTNVPAKPQLSIVPEIETGNVGIADLQQHHCRYPFTGIGAEPTYCGRRKMDGSSYCAEHHRLCYYGHGRYMSA